MERSLGCILVGYGRTEEGHHPVTQELSYGAFIAVYLLGEEGQALADQVAHLLGVELLRYGGEAFDISEEHGDLFALSLYGGSECQDFVCQMLRDVGERLRVVYRRGCFGLYQNLAAFATKLLP
jgi:hypothetical protein